MISSPCLVLLVSRVVSTFVNFAGMHGDGGQTTSWILYRVARARYFIVTVSLSPPRSLNGNDDGIVGQLEKCLRVTYDGLASPPSMRKNNTPIVTSCSILTNTDVKRQYIILTLI